MLFHRRQKTTHSVQNQRGFAYVVTVSAVLGAMTIMILSFSASTVQKALSSNDEKRQEQLNTALDELEQWYRVNADNLAMTGVYYGPDYLEQNALKRKYPGLRVAMSYPMNQMCSSTSSPLDCVPWRQLVAWYPNDFSGTSMSLIKGIPEVELSKSSLWGKRSTQEWDNQRVLFAIKQMDDLGRVLKSWFQSRQALDPVNAYSENFWRASNCSFIKYSLPCINGYTDVGGSDLEAILGFGKNELKPSWDGRLKFSNLEDSSIIGPYSVALQVVTPWGQTFKKVVIQP